jgi:hypothetical protein
MSKHAVQIAEAVAHALVDEAFKKSLISDPVAALASRGITFPEGHQVVVHQDTAAHRSLVVPTHPLPEAQRLTVLPRNPTAYQMALWVITEIQAGGPLADSLRQNPLTVLRNQGTFIPQSLQVVVHCNTESTTHLVVPQQGPTEMAGEELSDEMLDAVAGGKKKKSVTTTVAVAGTVVIAIEAATAAAVVVVLT